jgi:hypothetical protein
MLFFDDINTKNEYESKTGYSKMPQGWRGFKAGGQPLAGGPPPLRRLGVACPQRGLPSFPGRLAPNATLIYTDKMSPEQSASLLSSCTSGGCGAKLGSGAEIPAGLRVRQDPDLPVGFGGRDDAAVYRSPFGKTAAANALSGVRAAGGRPLFALNLSCFPEKLDRGIRFRPGGPRSAECAIYLWLEKYFLTGANDGYY